MADKTVLAGLKVQADRLTAIQAATTLPELERTHSYYQALAVIAADPVFAGVILMTDDDWQQVRAQLTPGGNPR